MSGKHRIELISLLALAIIIGLFFAYNLNRSNVQLNFNSNLPVLAEDTHPTTEPATSTIPEETPTPQIATTSQISSDGKKKAILETTVNSDDTQTFKLSTSDGTGENEQAIFNDNLDGKVTMSIPYNTWSPDNKYFFVHENSPEGEHVKVFKGNGEAFADGETFLDLTGIFKERVTAYNYGEATGWASETLIIVNTITQDNTKGPSYWFEVPSKAVIQLSTQF